MGSVRIAAVGLLALGFARGFRADPADTGVRAELRQLALRLATAVDDPEAITFNLSFDLHLANGSRKAFRLPTPRSGDADSARVTIFGVDAKAPDGAWVHILQATLIDNGALSYEPCALLRPGSEGDIRDVKTGFLLLKKQLRGLGEDPNIRLHIIIACRQAGGRVLSQAVTTDEFRIHVSPK
jgi:hypothetical protein